MSNDKDVSVWNANREELVFYSKERMVLLRMLVRIIRVWWCGATYEFPKPNCCDFLALEVRGCTQGIGDDQQGETHHPRITP